MSFISGFLFAVGRYVHMFFGALGVSLGGYKSCLKYGCESYCGYSTSDHIHFAMEKSFDEPWWNVIHKSQGQAIADGFIEGIENYEKGSDNMSKKIHVIKDESLGGVEREYIKVDRMAEVGDIAIQTSNWNAMKGNIAKVDYIADDCSGISLDNQPLTHCEYRVLEPTDIVHIDSIRYRMVDRKAEVGERVIISNVEDLNGNGYEIGNIFEVGITWARSSEGRSGIDTTCGITLYHEEYRVLVPADSELSAPKPPQSQDDIIANLVRRVSELEQQTTELEKDNERQAFKIDDLEQYCGGLKDDIETWAQEVEALKHEVAEMEPKQITLDVDTFMKIIGGAR